MSFLFWGLMIWLCLQPLAIPLGRFLADPSNVDPPSQD